MKSRLGTFFWIGGAIILGAAFSAGVLHLVNHDKDLLAVGPQAHSEERPSVLGGPSLRVDLESKEVIFLFDGVRKQSYTIVKLPDAHSAWFIAPGLYHVTAKELSHASPISHAHFATAISLGENMMISGPSNPESAKGGIELALADAQALFASVATGTPAVVVGEGARPTSVEATSVGGSDDAPVYFGADFDKSGSVVTSQAYLVGDLDTGEVLLAKNDSKVLPIASVSKLFTALVATDLIAASSSDLKKSKLFGLPYEELLYPMLLESNNSAAEELARLSGWDGFIEGMNKKAYSLGLADSSFQDPSGLSPHNVSTAQDLFKLAQYLYKDRTDILDITHTKSHGRWNNTNRLIRANDTRYIAGKTGYIPEAGQTFVSFFSFPLSEFKSRHLAVIVLRSANRYRDVAKITDAFSQAIYKPGGEGESMLALDPAVLDRETKKNTLLFVGDIMLDRGVRDVVEKSCAGDYGCMFAHASSLKAADITFGNLEGPLSDKGYDLKNLYSFRMSPSALPAIREAGFDVLSVANNHVGDWGRTAYEDTITRLRGAEIVPVGGGIDGDDARSVKVLERNGVRFGFVGFTDVGPTWLASPDNLPTVLLASDPHYADIIRTAKSQCDVLVVSIHFGEEYADAATARQVSLAHAAVDAGANIVVGHHPHVREPIEQYNGALIDYSLGNFIFDQPDGKTKEAGVLEINLVGTSTVNYSEHVAPLNAQFQPVFDAEGEF